MVFAKMIEIIRPILKIFFATVIILSLLVVCGFGIYFSINPSAVENFVVEEDNTGVEETDFLYPIGFENENTHFKNSVTVVSERLKHFSTKIRLLKNDHDIVIIGNKTGVFTMAILKALRDAQRNDVKVLVVEKLDKDMEFTDAMIATNNFRNNAEVIKVDYTLKYPPKSKKKDELSVITIDKIIEMKDLKPDLIILENDEGSADIDISALQSAKQTIKHFTPDVGIRGIESPFGDNLLVNETKYKKSTNESYIIYSIT